MGGGSTEKVLWDFIEFDKGGTDNMISYSVPFVSRWGSGMMVYIQGKFRPLGAPVGKVDGSVVV